MAIFKYIIGFYLFALICVSSVYAAHGALEKRERRNYAAEAQALDESVASVEANQILSLDNPKNIDIGWHEATAVPVIKAKDGARVSNRSCMLDRYVTQEAIESKKVEAVDADTTIGAEFKIKVMGRLSDHKQFLIKLLPRPRVKGRTNQCAENYGTNQLYIISYEKMAYLLETIKLMNQRTKNWKPTAPKPLFIPTPKPLEPGAKDPGKARLESEINDILDARGAQ